MHSHCLLQHYVRLRCSARVKDATLCSDYKRDSEIMMSSVSHYWPAAYNGKYIKSLCIPFFLFVK